MTQKSIMLILALVLLVSGLTGCGLFGGEEATPEPPPDAVSQPNVVSAEAFVAPVQQADLAFEIGGRVVSVEVEEGDTIKKGQTLAKLDDSVLQASLKEAEANLEQTKTLLLVSEADIAEAEARVVEAQANLAKVLAGATPEEIAEAEASVTSAEAALAEVIAGPTVEDIAQAETRVETTQTQLAQVLAGSRDEDIKAAATGLLQSEANVRLAQADYDENIYGEPDRAEPFGIALQQATLDYERTQAEYDKLLNGATDEEIAISRAQVREAEAALAKVLAGATPEQIAQTQAEVVRAEKALARIIAGPTNEDIAIAEANVKTAQISIGRSMAGMESNAGVVSQAEASLNSAQIQVAKTELTAPFEGVISSLDVEVGEIVQGGAAIIALGDTSLWQIETDDLTEIDVVQVRKGAKVQISVDALPGETFEGAVVRIKPKTETKAGDVTYTVLIDITKGDPSPLRWGMTTFVDIEVGPEL